MSESISRRKALTGLAALGVAAGQVIETGCSTVCLDDQVLFFLQIFGLLGNKPDQLAFLERNDKNCEEDRKFEPAEKERQRKNARALLNPSSTPEPASPSPLYPPWNPSSQSGSIPVRAVTAVQPESSATLTSTFVRTAVLPAINRAWILDSYGAPRIRILGTDPLRVVADLPIPGNTQSLHMVLSPDRATVYVLRSLGGSGSSVPNSVLAVNTQTNSFSTLLDIGGEGTMEMLAITPDGQNLYVVVKDNRSLTTGLQIVSIAERRVVRTIPFATSISDIVFTPDSVLCFCLSGSTISVIDLPGETIVNTVRVTGAPRKVAISRTGDRLYATAAYIEPFTSITTARIGIAIIDTSSLATVGYIPYAGPGSTRLMNNLIVHPSQNTLIATYRGERGYEAFDLATRALAGTFVPATPGIEDTYAIAIGTFPRT